MGLGEKLQAVKAKVNTRLGKQDGPVTFRLILPGVKLHAMHDVDFSSDDLIVTEGLALALLSSLRYNQPGTLQSGDLILSIPGGLVADDRIKNEALQILYGGKVYTPLERTPRIVGGVIIEWRLVSRASG